MQEIYDSLYDIDAEPIDPLEDYYTAISMATEDAGEGHTTELDSHTLFYLLEIYRITKVGGQNSPYACVEWPGIQIPYAILTLMDNKGLQFTFFYDKREREDHILKLLRAKPGGTRAGFRRLPGE
jgi:hypothetical protein